VKAEVYPSIIQGKTAAPGSKSAAQRMVACALLAQGESTIMNFPFNADCIAVINVAQALGAVVSTKGEDVVIRGGFPNAFRSGIRNPKTTLHCGESGLAARMFTSIAALSNQEFVIDGEGTLRNRTFLDFEKILPGFRVQVNTTNGLLPLKIQGPLQGASIEMDASVSSQFLSGLLMALPRAGQPSKIVVHQLTSKPYIELTLQIQQMFGVHVVSKNLSEFQIAPEQYIPQQVTVPGDWSGAAFILVAAALSAEQGVEVTNLQLHSAQADRAVIQALELAGVDVSISGDSVLVKQSTIKAFEFDANDCPDLFPPLAALAAFADGVSTIYGVKRLVHKESNRSKALQQEFAKANIRIVIRDDEMKIYPASVRRAVMNSHNDHRIAMAAAILGIGGDRITIRGAEAVNKSFPQFFDVLSALGGKVSRG
jgi:3-phosphoshikimate 1-carboxyvinyltransferase